MGQTWAEAKAKHHNTRRSVKIPLDQDAVEEAERLDGELPRIRQDDETIARDPQEPLVAERIQELERRAAESEVLFKFEGIGRGPHAKLQANYEATPEQKEKFGDALPYNPETFPPALMAASCIEPPELHSDLDEKGNVKDKAVLAEWQNIHDTWSGGQVKTLWSTCVDANGDVMATPKSARASAVLARPNSESS